MNEGENGSFPASRTAALASDIVDKDGPKGPHQRERSTTEECRGSGVSRLSLRLGGGW